MKSWLAHSFLGRRRRRGTDARDRLTRAHSRALQRAFGFRQVLRCPATILKHGTEIMHGDSAVESSSFDIPLSCSLHQLWSAPPALEQCTEIAHGIGIAEIRCLFVPALSGLVILWNARAGFGQFAETIHGTCEAQFGCFEIPIRSSR